MNNKLKVAALTTLLLTPTAVALADENDTSSEQENGSSEGTIQNPSTSLTATEDTAVNYFSKLSFSSSTADTAFYKQLLDDAFSDTTSAKYALLNGKLTYIIEFKKLLLESESLKSDISKLTLTSKTLITDVGTVQKKYDSLIMGMKKLNDGLLVLENAVSDEAYKKILSNIDKYYSKTKLVTDIMAELIGSSNQTILETRVTQVEDIIDSNYPTFIKNLYEATTVTTYKTDVDKAKESYALLTIDEKKIADSQVVAGSTTTYKQVLAAAETNIAKAAEFDAAVAKLNVNTNDEAGLEQLKSQIVAIDASYNKLTDIQKQLISQASQTMIAPFKSILEISSKISKLKASNSQEYRADLTAIEEMIDALTEISSDVNVIITKEVAQKIIPNLDKYQTAQADLTAAKDVEKVINDLKGGTTAPSSAQVKAARAAYTNDLSTNQKKLVNNLSDLTAWENAEKSATAVDNKIKAIVISAKADFYKKYADAQKAYDALNPEIEGNYVLKLPRLQSLKPYAEVVNSFLSLKPTDANYTTSMATLLEDVNAESGIWSEDTIKNLAGLSDQDKEQLKSVREALLDTRSSTEIAKDLVAEIDGLAAMEADSNQDILALLVKYRTAYKDLDSTAKKVVTNVKKLTAYEKKYLAPLKVVNLIAALDPLSNDFTKKIVAARKAYDKLKPNLNTYVKNSSHLVDLEKISHVMLELNDLKKSKEILVDAAAAKEHYDALVATLNTTTDAELLKILEGKYKPLLQLALDRDGQVNSIIRQIDALSTNASSSIGTDIDAIASAVKQLSSSDKKLVSNYQAFAIIQKDYKTAQKVVALINALPTQESTDYAKKIAAAGSAYNKLSVAQRKYVFNYDTLLKPYIAVASLIGDIDALKPTASDFATKVKQYRTRFDALTTDEKKQVYNIAKLEAAEVAVVGVDGVIALINAAKPAVEDYVKALQAARAAYDVLSREQQKQVTNYKELQTHEKELAPVLKLDELILSIGKQSTASKFISTYNSALKDLEKINLQNRKMLTNEKLLTEKYLPLYNVMLQIQNIKNTSKTFVTDVGDARKSYDTLTAEQKAQILNLDVLKEHEVNVLGGAYVDDLIRALKTNPASIYVQRVQEASEAYKNLSSVNKKAVSLYDELKVEEKFIAPVVSAIEAIDLLPVSGAKLATQVKKVNSLLAKLTDEQYMLITNLNKLDNLGNVINVVNLIELIKPSDTKYYIGNTKAAEIAYNKLSADEKQKVTNYSKLEEALLNVLALDQITKKISELSYLSSTFFKDIDGLLAEYKMLPSALKKQVSNYNVLETAEKDMNAAKKVISLIEAIDPNVRTFESKVIAARKALEKLTTEQKALVSNARLLQQYENELGL